MSDLQKILKDLNTEYGAGTVIRGKELEEKLEVIDSGSISLNIATTIGGIPVGKLIEMFGAESSGKSTMALHIMERFQKTGRDVVLCDFEQSFDKKYAKALGLEVDKIIYAQPECMEDGYNQIIELIKSKDVGLVVIDSHTAMIPRKIVDGEVGEGTVGLQARVNSTSIGKIKPLLAENRCTLLGISQTRVNIGGWGDPNIATGGFAWKFYSDIRFKISKKLEKDEFANRTEIEVIKNKCGVPMGKAHFFIEWGKGIDRMQEILDLSLEAGFVVRAGAWYEVAGERFQGEKKTKGFLLDNPQIAKELEEKIYKKYEKDITIPTKGS